MVDTPAKLVKRGLPKFIELPQPGATLTFARDPASGVDVALDDLEMTRGPHARLRIADDGRVWVSDLTGADRTTVSGRVIGSTEMGVNDGDWVRFGQVPYELVGRSLELRLENDGVQIEAVKATVDVKSKKGLRRLLDRVSFKIEAHEFVGIIGPSGAGKSTLLRVLADEQKLSSGYVEISDHRGPLHDDWTANSLGFVPQDDALHGHLTVEESLAYAADLRLRPEESKTRALQRVLSQLDLNSVGELNIEDQISGGQRKRVNVGHELLSRPRLLCLDEPTAGLDPHLERELMTCFQGMAREGCTVVCTTHIMESLDLFDRLIVLAEGGRLAFCGSPQDLLEHFQIESPSSLYPKLTGESSWAFQPQGEENREQRTSLRKAERPRSLFNQLSVLTRRYTRLSLFDPKTAWTCFLLPLLVGLGIRLALPDLVDKESMLFFGVVAMLWFGLQGSALEIVKERSIFLRERRTGLAIWPYLLSKILVLALIGLGQTLTLSLTFYLSFQDEKLLGLPTGFLDGFLGLSFFGHSVYATAVLWGTYVVGMALGLVLSAFVSRERQANLLVPMLVIPMLLFSAKGMAASDTLQFLTDASPELPREWLSALNPARHGYELIYYLMRFGDMPSLTRAPLEYGVLFAVPVFSMGLSLWLLSRVGRRSVVILSDLDIPALNKPELSDQDRARALQATMLYRNSGRCPRCAYKRVVEGRCTQCSTDPRSPKAAEFIEGSSGVKELLRGASYLPRGFWFMVSRMKVLRLAIVPLLLNIAFIVGAFYFAAGLQESLQNNSGTMFNSWSGPVWGRLRFGAVVVAQWSATLSVIFIPMVAAYVFALLGKFPLMPFMELLAEKTCDEMLGDPPDLPFDMKLFIRNLVIGLWDALLVTVLQLLLLIVFFPLAYLPLIGPLLWFTLPPAFGASIDYVDLSLVVRHYRFKEKIRLLWRRKARFFGFGIAFFLCLEIPWINLILGMVLLPTAAVGATLLFLELDER
jgi:ABC transport system ATP-binding/permease protein